MKMETNVHQRSKFRQFCRVAAWASPFVEAVIAALFWFWSESHKGEGHRGERPPVEVLFYLVLLVASALGFLAAIISLFGIRSGRNALFIIPGALLGIGIGGVNMFLCGLSYGLLGVNIGG